MIEDDDRETTYRDYTATMQKHLVNMLGRWFVGEEWEPMPSYLEMVHDQETVPRTQETNEDAKAHVYKIFGVTPPERG